MATLPSESTDLSNYSGLATGSGLPPELVEAVATVASDIALVIDDRGVIRRVTQGAAQPLPASASAWIGQLWADTVTAETRVKIEQMLKDVAARGVSRTRQVNHPVTDGADIPVAYSAIRLGDNGPVLATGRDLSKVAAAQQRFVATQSELERDFVRLREDEARYRHLFQADADALLVLDGQSLLVIDVNRAACQLFDVSSTQLIGKDATIGFDRSSRPAVNELLTIVCASGTTAETCAQLAGRRVAASVSITPLRTTDKALLLVRARVITASEDLASTNARLADLVDRTPDAVVVTDLAGMVLSANPAFVDLVQVSDESVVRDTRLSTWLGAEHAPVADLLAGVRQRGTVPQAASAVRGTKGRSLPVDVSAALLPGRQREVIGFIVRLRDTRSHPAKSSGPWLVELDSAARQLGTLSLPLLLREMNARGERHFIEQAIRQFDGDTARAARWLRISPRSLQARLKRARPPTTADGD